MSCEKCIHVETRLIASLQRADFTNDLGLLYQQIALKLILSRLETT
ncbi:hypothetical protein [Dulcicalothrix desertica]|nr:hypothetical protein [Dulcicalothrix desertica]